MSRPESIIITFTTASFLTEGKEYEVHEWSRVGNPRIRDDYGDLICISRSEWKPAPKKAEEMPLDFVPQIKKVLEKTLDEIEEHEDATDIVGLTVDSKPVFKDQRTAKAVRKTITIKYIQYAE